MDYKDTLNLPRTDFAMKADLVTREPQRLERWEREQIYAQIQAARKGAPKFVLHDGPPFANGDVHIGTALNKILKDIIVKYKTLRGFDAPYVPGWDCHGLPIEFKVSQEMRKAGNTAADAATIRTACEAYARKFIDLQRAQFKRLGVFGDWENPYLTLNKEYEADELRLFADIVEKGFVYRGKKPVYWSIPCRTALAEAEVEYQDHVSQSVYVKFKLKGEPNTFLIIWTTTPWTLPANLAVAFSSKFYYSLVHTNGESYLVCNSLLDQVAAKCNWPGYEIIRTVHADELATLEYEHPFCARTGKAFAGDEFVDNTTGTGFVHIAPGHGTEDYLLGRRVGLPIYSPVNDDGCLAHTNDLPIEQQMPAALLGKSILEKHGKSDANEAVLHELRVRNALLHQENYHHSYPHCWRSKTPIIFRAMDQWFIKIDHVFDTNSPPASFGVPPNEPQSAPRDASHNLPEAGAPQTFRELALTEINRVAWIPDWGKSRIEAAVKGRPDWCISRQRSWGVPLPAFYDAQGVLNVAALVEQHGSNVWFEKTAAELWSLVRPKDWNGAEAVAKSNDTLDVWIDSGSSSRAVLMRREELMHLIYPQELAMGEWGYRQNADDGGVSFFIPTDQSPETKSRPMCFDFRADIYLEGSDQHRGWFQSSLLLSLAGNGAAPFKSVLTHGFMVDEDRQKVSKSKQGQNVYEKPQTAERYIKDYGADVIRLWVASQDYRNDIVVSEERIKKVAETYRALRNTLRYQLSNLYDFDPAQHTVPDDQLTGLDRWVLGEFAKLEADVAAAYDAYEFHVVYQKISQFAAVELSSQYHNFVKDRLYTGRYGVHARRSTQTALHRMVTRLCQMLAPVLAFTAEEAWECVPAKHAASVHCETWEPKEFTLNENELWKWSSYFRIRDQALPELEKARQAKIIGKSLEAKARVAGFSWPVFQAIAEDEQELKEVLMVSQLEIELALGSQSTVGTIEINKATGQKCECCWHWETDVGANIEHSTICSRCVEAVNEWQRRREIP